MCKKIFITDLKRETAIGKIFNDVFFLKKITKENTGKTLSFSLVLSDKTGEIQCRIWHENLKNEYLEFKNKVVKASGIVTTYKGLNTLTIDKLSMVSVYDPCDFIDVANDNNLYENFIKKYHKDIKKPHLIKLLDSFYMNEIYRKRFKKLQSAKMMHHVKVGGYMEHVNTVYDISKTIADKYMLHPFFDIEILLAAAALHDIGKVYEYKLLPVNQRTDLGILLGHLALSVCMVYKAISDIPNFPELDKTKLLHSIYTSHGDQDKVIKPSCIEALILNRVDELDARIDGFNNIIATDQGDESFTKFNNLLNQYLYKL